MYSGNSFTTESKGTKVYLVTNPYITGTDPSPSAFTNIFNAQGQLSAATLAAAQSMFSINYLTATYETSFNARLMAASSQANSIYVYFNTPSYNSVSLVLTVSNVQIVGNVGTVYFVLVLYKQITTNADGTSNVNIRMNYSPTPEQILNCQNWEGLAA